MCFMRLIADIAKAIFYALPGIVAFVVAALSLAVVYMEELQVRLREQHRFRWIVAIALVVMGVGAFLSDAVQKANDRADRQKAVEDTAKRVAKETTENVTEAMGKQYGGLVTSLNAQVGDLKAQLLDQSKRVKEIGESNIVTGKKPITVNVANPEALVKGEPGPEFHATEVPVDPDPKYGKHATRILLTTNKTMNGAQVAIHCAHKINHGFAGMPGAGVMLVAGQEVVNGQTFVVRITSPNWSPTFPMLITLYYDDDSVGPCEISPLR